MVKLARFEIFNNYTHNLLSWDFTEDSEVNLNSKIKVYRSLSPGIAGSLEDYTCIASGISPEATYQDTDITRKTTLIWHYKLTLDDNLISDTPAFIKSYSADYTIKTIVTQKNLVMNKYIGRDFILLRKRLWGQRCSRCWDTTLFRVSDSKCPICYGTGWTGGYFKPIPIKGMLNPAPSYVQIQMFGEWKPSDTLLTTLNFPLLTERDIIIDDMGRRWLVYQKRTIEKLGYVLEQSAQLALIASDDIIYSFPLTT